jgi:hypothetical protein
VSELTTREIALIFWSAVFFGWAMTHQTVRESFARVVVSAFASKLLWVWFTVAAYTVGLVTGLEKVGLWDESLTKETLVWFVFSAVVYPFQFSDPAAQPRVLAVVAKDSISALILIEVLIDTYTLSLPVELILVPVLTLIALLGTVAALKDEHKQVASFMTGIQAVVGLSLAALAIRAALNDPDLNPRAEVFGVLLPVLLSLGILPYIYALRVAFAYEGMLWRIGWKKGVARSFQHYAAAKIMWHLKLRPTALSGFLRRNGMRLHELTTAGAVRSLLTDDKIANGTDHDRQRHNGA